MNWEEIVRALREGNYSALNPLDFTPPPESPEAAAKRRAAAERARRAHEAAIREKYTITPEQIYGTAPVTAGGPSGPLSNLEGGNPDKLQMSPEIIDALRRSGVE